MQLSRNIFGLTGLVLFSCFSIGAAQDDWRQWRGPNSDGHAAEGQTPPTTWSEDENIVWKTKVPGRGHATPIVVDQKIFLATAVRQAETQSVVCYDRKSGKQLWEKELNRGELNPRIHQKNTHASSTIATDGQHVFAVFNNHRSVKITALDFDGNQVWEKNAGEFRAPFPFGFGASPIVFGKHVIVANLNNGEGSGVTAYDCKTGDVNWKLDRPKATSYSTPVVAEVAGKKQLLLSGDKKVISVNPENGELNWTCDATWNVTCGMMVWDDDLVYASGGYPTQQTLAVKADGSGAMVWDNGMKAYEQSMILHDGYLYAHLENGAIVCIKAADGQEMWKERFSRRREAQSASPVFANGHVYFTSESGNTLVIKPNSEKMEVVARNKLGDESFPSFAICGNQLFARVAIYDETNQRQEWLFCIGEN